MSEHRDRILAEACELYLAEGLEGFSMRALARAVGVTAPALYKHYDSREAVLADVIGEAYRLLSRRLYQALAGRTPTERFRLAGRAHLDFALAHRRYYELIYTHPKLLGMEALPPEVEAQGCAIHQFFIDRMRECMSAEILRDEDPEEAAVTLWAHAHGLISLYLGGILSDPSGEPIDEEAFRAMYLISGTRLMRGMATQPLVEELEGEIETLRTGGVEAGTAGSADRSRPEGRGPAVVRERDRAPAAPGAGAT